MTLNADFILKNAVLLTMDANLTIYEPGALAIQADKSWRLARSRYLHSIHFRAIDRLPWEKYSCLGW
jgi:hypothetical protein